MPRNAEDGLGEVDGTEGFPDEASEGQDDEGYDRSEEYETLRKETFLAVYNLYRVGLAHEEYISKIGEMLEEILRRLDAISPKQAVKQSAVNDGSPTKQSEPVASIFGIPLKWLIAGGALLLFGGVGLFLLVMRLHGGG